MAAGTIGDQEVTRSAAVNEVPDEGEGDRLAVAEVLRGIAAHGYSLTRQRRTLVVFIMSHRKPFTPDALLTELRVEDVEVGRATVFRTIDLLANLGYLHRQGRGEQGTYIACAPHHHHHLVCSQCGQVLHFEECPIDDLLGDLESRTGYHIEHHSLELAGVCPACRA